MSSFGAEAVGRSIFDTVNGGSNVSPSLAIAAGIFADLTSATANFNAVRASQNEARAQTRTLGHRARMLDLDRRAAMRQAESILGQTQSQIATRTLEGGQRRAAITASEAARGVEAGVGSSAEVQLSEKLIEQIDVYHINLAGVQSANAARRGAVDIGNQALFDRTSARNLRGSVRTAAPESALIGGIGRTAARAAYLSNYRTR